MKYVVIKDFYDMQDGNRIYSEGDAYPRKGTAKKERIEELLSDDNLLGVPVIALVEEGGDPNGSK